MTRTTSTRTLPDRISRRLPPFLEENYEVNFDSDRIKLPRTPRTTLKSTAYPKKKCLAKKKIIHRPVLSLARDSFSSNYHSDKKVPYIGTRICGTDDRSKWAISSLSTTPSSTTVDHVLSGCYYHPGSLKPVSSNAHHSIEICFCFDTTGSMMSCIGELKQKLQVMMQQLLKDIPTIKIAIMGIGDYCDVKSSYAIEKLDFSNDVDVLVGFVQQLSHTGGGDAEECYEMALMEAQNLKWTTDVDDSFVTKCVVMIGDDLPHPTGTYLGIDWKEQVKILRDKIGCKIYSVQCMKRSYANDFYQIMADETLGQRFLLENFSAISEMFMGLCYREATEHAEKNFAQDDKINEEGVSIVRPNSSTSSTSLSDENIIKIHNAIHDRAQEKVNIGGIEYEISIGSAMCRFVRINDITYIEQNKEKKTKYARMALEGKKITWITHGGQWGLVVDDDILRR